jgi:hypothetical protein
MISTTTRQAAESAGCMEACGSELPPSAVIQLTEFGADIELSDGRRAYLWQFAIKEPIESAAARWAEKRGATLITMHTRPPNGDSSPPNTAAQRQI